MLELLRKCCVFKATPHQKLPGVSAITETSPAPIQHPFHGKIVTGSLMFLGLPDICSIKNITLSRSFLLQAATNLQH